MKALEATATGTTIMAFRPTTSRARVATKNLHAHDHLSNNSNISTNSNIRSSNSNSNNSNITSNTNIISPTRACDFRGHRLTPGRNQCSHHPTCTMAAIMVSQSKISGHWAPSRRLNLDTSLLLNKLTVNNRLVRELAHRPDLKDRITSPLVLSLNANLLEAHRPTITISNSSPSKDSSPAPPQRVIHRTTNNLDHRNLIMGLASGLAMDTAIARRHPHLKVTQLCSMPVTTRILLHAHLSDHHLLLVADLRRITLSKLPTCIPS
jgi:hypothetical protein